MAYYYLCFFFCVYDDSKLPTNQRQQDFQFDEYHNRQMIPYDVNIPRPSGSHFYHYLRLIWNEQDLTNEYTLRYNTTRRGFWVSSAPQKGSFFYVYCAFAENLFSSSCKSSNLYRAQQILISPPQLVSCVLNLFANRLFFYFSNQKTHNSPFPQAQC